MENTTNLNNKKFSLKKEKRRSKERYLSFRVINTCVMIFLVFCFIVPFWIIIVTAFSNYDQVRVNGISMWFQGFSLEGFKTLFTYKGTTYKGNLFLHSMWVSFYTSFLTATLSTIICTLAGYSLSKKYLPGRKAINIFLVITMFFSGGTIPLYLVIRDIGIFDTMWALILPGCVGAHNILLVRNFFYSIPKSLEEAAYVDGANDWKVLLKIFFPLGMPIMVTIWLSTFVTRWNSWLPSLLYLNTQSESLWTVQYVLRKILTESNMFASDAPITIAQNAGILLVILPLVLMSPILQKYYQKGLVAGADKG